MFISSLLSSVRWKKARKQHLREQNRRIKQMTLHYAHFVISLYNTQATFSVRQIYSKLRRFWNSEAIRDERSPWGLPKTREEREKEKKKKKMAFRFDYRDVTAFKVLLVLSFMYGLMSALVYSIVHLKFVKPLDSDAPLDRFSEARAIQHVRVLADEIGDRQVSPR